MSELKLVEAEALLNSGKHAQAEAFFKGLAGIGPQQPCTV